MSPPPCHLRLAVSPPPRGDGVLRDDAQGGKLLFDEPVVIQCYTSGEAIERQAAKLREFLPRMYLAGRPACHLSILRRWLMGCWSDRHLRGCVAWRRSVRRNGL